MSHGTGFYAEIEKLFRPVEYAFLAMDDGFLRSIARLRRSRDIARRWTHFAHKPRRGPTVRAGISAFQWRNHQSKMSDIR
ncbi:hypothetical protein [Paraburkholderia sp. JHI869]|uniref:hypothetical protein n=1 Tax=Paraburkholderia sp. JHI869 TaxID=3112959 RepID=UPI00316F260E